MQQDSEIGATEDHKNGGQPEIDQATRHRQACQRCYQQKKKAGPWQVRLVQKADMATVPPLFPLRWPERSRGPLFWIEGCV